MECVVEVACACAVVRDEFTRPEATTLCGNGRCTPRIDERGNIGADKSAPYKNLQKRSVTPTYGQQKIPNTSSGR
ncbi:MAG: hypothetical protein FWG87_09270 [Defluviitaleaceae bacterium]|nr:hypothetical protein [Defluviitaleaceae bacterium]